MHGLNPEQAFLATLCLIIVAFSIAVAMLGIVKIIRLLRHPANNPRDEGADGDTCQLCGRDAGYYTRADVDALWERLKDYRFQDDESPDTDPRLVEIARKGRG